MKMGSVGWFVWVFSVILLPAFVLAACEDEEPEVVEQVRAIKTITVTQPAFGDVRKYPGITQAKDSSALSFQVRGNVQAVNVELGERVEEGQVLAAKADPNLRDAYGDTPSSQMLPPVSQSARGTAIALASTAPAVHPHGQEDGEVLGRGVHRNSACGT